MNNQTNKYRADIDGLRAIAVLSVIIFHLDKNILPGGFVGVDILFVLSGYLISLYIYEKMAQGQFSITEFYRRRIKRIAPVMLAVLLFVLIVSQLLLLPKDAKAVSESVIWSLLSMVNIHFYLSQDTSYFAAAMDEKPLLHFWSLAVEEQFYLVWPAILLIFYPARHSKLFLWLLVLMAFISFFAAQYFYASDASLVYYMLPTRAGELLIGAIIAYIIHKKIFSKLSTAILNFISFVGLLLVTLSLIIISEESVFPGFIALIPTVGTACIVFSGQYQSNLITRFLTLKPMVFIGLISYSAYLWHWPIIAFFRYGLFEQNLMTNIALFTLILLLAWLSYHYIEQPFRYTTGNFNKVFTRQYLIPATCITIVAVVAYQVNGFGLRQFSSTYQVKLQSTLSDVKPSYSYKYICQKRRIKTKDITDTNCIIGQTSRIDNQGNAYIPSEEPEVLLLGDSNAAHYVGMIGAFARKQGFLFRNIQINSCPPIRQKIRKHMKIEYYASCRDSLKLLWTKLADYQVIIISASWLDYQSKSSDFLADFYHTVLHLTNKIKHVIILGKVPIIRSYNRNCRARSLSFPLMQCYKPSTSLNKGIANINLELMGFAKENSLVEYFDANSYLCPDNNCSAYNSRGEALYFDQSHLSVPGSWKLGKEIIKQEGVPYPFNLLGESVGH
ncbi:MAG: acyltransferase [Colwellia sp.]|nr:acyltransferase [Colwellia sp.]